MHAVWADNNMWISNVDIVHAENCDWTVKWSNTLCPTKMYGARSTDGNNSFCILCILYISCKHDYYYMCTHTCTHTHTHYILTCTHNVHTHTHLHAHTHKHTGMNKKLEDNLFAHCVSLVLFNIMSFYLIMLLQGTCCSWEFTWHILVCRFSCFHYVAFYRHFSKVYY